MLTWIKNHEFKLFRYVDKNYQNTKFWVQVFGKYFNFDNQRMNFREICRMIFF